jgi:lysozyme family protein
MTRFQECMKLLLISEGGYSNDPADRGGATKCGITQIVYDNWRIAHGLGRSPVVGISGEEIELIYGDYYWKPSRCQFLPAPLDYVQFDGAVNHGVGQAAKFLQRALQVSADGSIGPVTLQAVKEEQDADQIMAVVDSILEQRGRFYDSLIAAHPEQGKFGKGWHNRLAHVRDAAYGQA